MRPAVLVLTLCAAVLSGVLIRDVADTAVLPEDTRIAIRSACSVALSLSLALCRSAAAAAATLALWLQGAMHSLWCLALDGLLFAAQHVSHYSREGLGAAAAAAVWLKSAMHSLWCLIPSLLGSGTAVEDAGRLGQEAQTLSRATSPDPWHLADAVLHAYHACLALSLLVSSLTALAWFASRNRDSITMLELPRLVMTFALPFACYRLGVWHATPPDGLWQVAMAAATRLLATEAASLKATALLRLLPLAVGVACFEALRQSPHLRRALRVLCDVVVLLTAVMAAFGFPVVAALAVPALALALPSVARYIFCCVTGRATASGVVVNVGEARRGHDEAPRGDAAAVAGDGDVECSICYDGAGTTAVRCPAGRHLFCQDCFDALVDVKARDTAYVRRCLAQGFGFVVSCPFFDGKWTRAQLLAHCRPSTCAAVEAALGRAYPQEDRIEVLHLRQRPVPEAAAARLARRRRVMEAEGRVRQLFHMDQG